MKFPIVNKPSDNIGDYLIFLSGEKKVGKTAFCTQFPEHLILEFETGNAKHLNARYIDIPDLKTLNEAKKMLLENKGKYKTLVIDEINILYELIMMKICKDNGIMDLQEIGFGRGWNAVRREFEGWIRFFQSLDVGVIYTGHNLVKTVQTKQRQEISSLESKLNKAVNEIMERYVHMWFCMLFDSNNNRILQVEGDGYVKAGHGLKEQHFQKVIEGQIPLGHSPQLAFRNFMLAWNNQPIVTTQKPVNPQKVQRGKQLFG